MLKQFRNFGHFQTRIIPTPLTHTHTYLHSHTHTHRHPTHTHKHAHTQTHTYTQTRWRTRPPQLGKHFHVKHVNRICNYSLDINNNLSQNCKHINKTSTNLFWVKTRIKILRRKKLLPINQTRTQTSSITPFLVRIVFVRITRLKFGQILIK